MNTFQACITWECVPLSLQLKLPGLRSDNLHSCKARSVLRSVFLEQHNNKFQILVTWKRTKCSSGDACLLEACSWSIVETQLNDSRTIMALESPTLMKTYWIISILELALGRGGHCDNFLFCSRINVSCIDVDFTLALGCVLVFDEQQWTIVVWQPLALCKLVLLY